MESEFKPFVSAGFETFKHAMAYAVSWTPPEGRNLLINIYWPRFNAFLQEQLCR
jgi:hypothetical protein